MRSVIGNKLASLHELAKQNTLLSVTPFARSQKSQHKCIVSNSGWKLFPIIKKQGVKWMEKECSGWEKIEKIINGGGHLLDT